VKSYIEKYLMEGEHIVYRTYLTRLVYLKPAVFAFIALLLIALGNWIVPDSVISFISGSNLDSVLSPFGIDSIRFIGLAILLLLAVPYGLSAFVRRYTSEFGLSNKRVLIKTGFIKRVSYETLLSKIEGIGVEQGIFERIFDFGKIVITGTGGTREIFDDITRPLVFRKKIQEQLSIIDEI
jgi:uncharacterized membrane protein YdbT with pleckstrin-like domain